MQELRSIRDWIRWGASRFREAGLTFGHGTDNAFDEAAWLVLHALHLPLDLDERWWGCGVTGPEARRVEAMLRERETTRRPAAYITGEAWFAGLDFAVDERVLVPRSPIAELIAQGFSPWKEPDAVHRVLDLCTGSGCIGIATAAHLPWVEVVASDVSSDALRVAETNRQRHGVGDRVRLVASDLFDALDDAGTFDVIVTNPPYVDARDMRALTPEFRAEPRLGLAAGEDGLDLVRRILRDAPQYLAPGGVLICEVGNSAAALEEAFPDVAFVWVDFEHGGAGVFVLTRDALQAIRFDA